MKITLILSFVLCCVIATAQEPVQLEVWRVNTSNPFRGVFDKFCYLPNFRNGLAPNAMVVRKRSWDDKTDRMETWYNRDIADTLNQFTWPFGFCPSLTPDINGDGQRDFFEGTKFYLGTKNDEPDTNTVYQYPGNSIGYAKFNADNCDDLYYYGTSPYLAHFRFGNPIPGKFQSVSIKSTYTEKDSQLEEYIKALYKNKQGQWRLLTLSRGWTDGLYERIWQSKKSALRLYALEFTAINKDSTIVTTTQIDEYKDPKWLEFEEDYNSKDPSIWSPFNSSKLLYQSEHYPKILYYASMNTMPDKETKKYDSYAKAFDLTDDKIRLLDVNIPNKTTDSKKLQYSITGNNYEEIYYVNGDGTIQFMKINEDNIPQRICYIDRNASPLRWGNVTHLQAVKDINNDGINDIACLLSSSADGNTLAIVKGKNITTSLEDKTYISEPYPIPSTTQLAIPLYIASPHHYTLHLFSQTGKEVKVLFDGDLSSGSHTLHCNISDFPSGTYILRLSDGTTLIDRLIIINH
ncbi:MAG TPA: hypothetical protein PLQ21_01095 [Candidatus Kapabacteria bacterium]|nr:hypothetical protein [Candidatus Kapabacteria bacterium]